MGEDNDTKQSQEEKALDNDKEDKKEDENKEN